MRPERLVLLLMLVAAPVAAQTGSTAGALELYPTLQAVGARLAYIGDTDADATARLEWRLQGGSSWNAGVAMTRITSQRWAGSVMWLDPNTPYEVRALIDDPDGGGSVTGVVRTRREPVAAPTGRTWWVATTGNDSDPGDAARPLRTVQAAVAGALPGEEIRVRPGIYRETIDTPRGGTASAFIILTADAPGVILDGSDPAMLQRTDWRDDGGGIFSVPYTSTTRLVCADSLQRLYHQATLAALQSNANGMTQGFALEGGRLYVKLEDRSSPSGHTMHVARYNEGIWIDTPFWSVSGFEVRYFGNAAGGTGIQLNGASGCWISGNTTYAIGGKGIWLRKGAADNLVERNLCFDPRIGGWPWAACKGHEEELQGISNYGDRGNVVRLNTVRGTFDGIDAGDDVTENGAADMDINDNLITQVADDALETEVFDGINVRVWKNRVDDVFSGCSVAPNYVGPEYILYNTITNYRRSGFKFSITSTGETWICHNTVTSAVAGTPAVKPSGPYSNKRFRNNILVGTGASSVDDDLGESQSGCDFDGDLIHAYGAPVFRWKGIDYASIATLRSATGFEVRGLAGDPLFVSAPLGNYALTPASPAIDAALRLPGINDRFNGAGPDMGAHESASGPDTVAPAAIRDLR